MPLVSTTGGVATEGAGAPAVAVQTIAGAGSVIANAAVLSSTAGLCVVSGADNTVGAVLPTAAPGKVIYVYSSAATAGLSIYPPVNSTINGGSANAAVVIEGKSLAVFVGTTSTNWAAFYTANS
jgi:hypothetical protein